MNRIRCSLRNLTDEYEIVLVNDGSPDGSLESAVALRNKYSRIKIVDLTRNFGHHKAMLAGLQHASGDNIFLIDCDLEEKPELIVEFWQTMCQSPGVDLIYGVQQGVRKGGWLERLTGSLYYLAYRVIADDGRVRLMTRRYVEALLKFEERDFYFGPMCSLAGFTQRPLGITKGNKGVSSYSAFRKYQLFLDSILAFSQKPLYAIYYTGISVTLLTLAYSGYIVATKVFFSVGVEGWTSLLVAICFFGGLNILFMGIIAIYIAKILVEVKRRPPFLVKEILGPEPESAERMYDRESAA